jgi:hypothetical protein
VKRSKKELEDKTKAITIDLLCWAGLKNAKKITKQVRQNVKSVKEVMKLVQLNLQKEENRRKELKRK